MNTPGIRADWNRRSLVGVGVRCLALASLPPALLRAAEDSAVRDADPSPVVDAIVRPQTLFAGIRKPITSRAELEPRIAILEKACAGRIAGPLTHIFRFDTPVEGYDSEIGFPVSEPVTTDDVVTHTLREMHFYSATHEGPPDTLRETSRMLYQRLNAAGLSPELELVEVYEHRDVARPERSKTRIMVSYLAWPEVYRSQLVRVLGEEPAREIWEGGDRITPFTCVDERCRWVGASIDCLKARTTVEQQFDILSRVSLVRPRENVVKYKAIYDREKDIHAVFRAQEDELARTPTGGFLDPHRFDGKVLHCSKVPYNREAYLAATNHTERRKAFCFCALIREATDPRIDPIFCYRAAGWARQFWEPILEVEFTSCTITHSILKGDAYCAWDYHLS
jgi:effector-binding domain-containing protein